MFDPDSIIWTDFDKAEWILKNGVPDISWVYERANGIIYRRPSEVLSRNLPPWINIKKRMPIELQDIHNGDTHDSRN